MQTLKQQSVWLKFLLLLLAAQIVWTYLDPQLAVYLSTDGVFQHKWSAETAPILGPKLTAWLTSLFQPHVFRLVIAVGMLGAVGLLFPRNKSVFLGAVLVSLIIQALFLFRNPNFYVIHRPYIGMLIAFLPFLLWKSDTTFRLRPIDWLWCVTSVTYLASAISKLAHPDWLAGTALAELHGFPIRSELLIGLSTDVLLTKALTYSTIAAELLHGTTAFFRRFRFISWLAVFTMHLFALPTLQIYVATIPMLIFHLFLFDPNWLKARFFNGKWLADPRWELPFVYSFVWVIPIVILLSTKSRLESTALLLPLVILLSQGHKFAPHILLLLDRKAWQHVKQQRPRIKIELVGLIAAPTLIACLTAFLYQPDTVPSEYSKAFYIPVALLAAIYAGWTYFHFSQQNLGILRIYRRLNSTEEDTVLRRVESFLVTSVALFLAAILCTFANERLGFFLFFFSPLKMPDSLRLACLLLAVGAGCALAFLYGRKGLLNLPTFLGITHFVALTALMCLVPVYLALVAVSVSHWTQAIYLTSLQIGAARSSPSRRLQAPLVIGSILLFSSIMYFAYEFLQTKLPAPSNFGKPDNFELFSPTWIWLGLIYFGFNIGINYTHFYLERFIYRRNPRLISVEK